MHNCWESALAPTAAEFFRILLDLDVLFKAVMRHAISPVLLLPEDCRGTLRMMSCKCRSRMVGLPTKVCPRVRVRLCSEIKVDAKLNLTFWKSRYKTQRLAG